MSHWNHRVIKKTVRGETFYGVYEVYYNNNNEPYGCTENSVEPSGETLEELQKDILRFARAAELPVLDFEYFENLSKKKDEEETSNDA